MNKKIIVPKELQEKYDSWHFSPAVESNGFVFVSGCTGKKIDGTISNDEIVQIRQSFLTVEKSLNEAGLTFKNIIEITSYHTDIQKNIKKFMTVKDEFITEPYPAWTAVGVSELAVKGAVIEISVRASVS